MAVIAAKCPRYKVTVVEINKGKIDHRNSDSLPIYELGLDGIVKARRTFQPESEDLPRMDPPHRSCRRHTRNAHCRS